ncbi:MAG: sialate O-acetylesterase [Verrucomicrobia bacterium]|nr:sialate O-acetylesterase [Verrucomicrobiota bacterium]
MNHTTTSHRRKIHLILSASTLLSAMPATADVRLPKIFTDNMLLQRDLPVRVWGWADADEAVSVTLAGKNAKTKANQKGQWLLELPAIKTGENLELTVQGNNSLTLKNILIGDIWVCSGQSNMEMGLGGCLGSEEDIKAADLPKIRRIKFDHVQAAMPSLEAPTATPWQVCSPQTAAGFSAVGFYFAREILQKTGVPIGIVDDNWGGTPIEPWVPTAGLELVAELKPQFTARQEAINAYQSTHLPKALTEMEAWIAKTRGQLTNGVPTSPPPAIPPHPGGEGWSGMFNAMIHPVVHLPIKGALWYQGESNGGEGETYYDKMRALIGGWRQQWGQGDFPFYYVQLASFQAPSEDPAGGNGWAKLREAQTKSLTIPNTGMAVITDTVPLAERDDIHPRNKYDVGLRLALWALGRDYGQQQLEVSGPLFKALKIEGNKARLAFEHTGTGLMIGKKEGRNPAAEAKGEKLKRFAIAGADKKWFWADAVLENNTVTVSSPDVKEPVAVRYAFQMNPDGANLYNREGLPASPFRTDAW